MDPELREGVNMEISKYKNIFAKGYTSNWSKKNRRENVEKKVEKTVPWT